MPRRIRRPLDDEPPDELGVNSARDERGRFRPGNRCSRGNAGQRERGRLRRSIERALGDDDLDRIVQAMIRRAQRGDMHAARILLERVGGRPRLERDDERAALDIGTLDSLESCARAQRDVLAAVTSGTITLSQGERLTALVESCAARLRDDELERRITELEALEPSS